MNNEPLNLESLVIEGAGQQFNGDAFRSLLGPGVYVLMAGEVPQYVGTGRRLLHRVSGRHHKQHLVDKCTGVLLFPCTSLQAADELETELIGRLQPPGNTNKRLTLAARAMGVKHLSIKARVKFMLQLEPRSPDVA